MIKISKCRLSWKCYELTSIDVIFEVYTGFKMSMLVFWVADFRSGHNIGRVIDRYELLVTVAVEVLRGLARKVIWGLVVQLSSKWNTLPICRISNNYQELWLHPHSKLCADTSINVWGERTASIFRTDRYALLMINKARFVVMQCVTPCNLGQNASIILPRQVARVTAKMVLSRKVSHCI